ncbi:MAG TPA: hypothetical protein VJB14_04765 [Planctomycetota bacterium]|nr:hypothetical protein [Planctomycetota bacterium]
MFGILHDSLMTVRRLSTLDGEGAGKYVDVAVQVRCRFERRSRVVRGVDGAEEFADASVVMRKSTVPPFRRHDRAILAGEGEFSVLDVTEARGLFGSGTWLRLNLANLAPAAPTEAEE